jgi:hypothetical protein
LLQRSSKDDDHEDDEPPKSKNQHRQRQPYGQAFFSGHHKAGVKRMARVAAKRIEAGKSLEYFRPNTTIVIATAAVKLRTAGEPRTVIACMIKFSFFG